MKPVKLIEKFGLTEGEARLVLATAGKNNRTAKRLAKDMTAKLALGPTDTSEEQRSTPSNPIYIG